MHTVAARPPLEQTHMDTMTEAHSLSIDGRHTIVVCHDEIVMNLPSSWHNARTAVPDIGDVWYTIPTTTHIGDTQEACFGFKAIA